MSKMKDKVAVITGGNSGIGLATAKALDREGAQIALLGHELVVDGGMSQL